MLRRISRELHPSLLFPILPFAACSIHSNSHHYHWPSERSHPRSLSLAHAFARPLALSLAAHFHRVRDCGGGGPRAIVEEERKEEGREEALVGRIYLEEEDDDAGMAAHIQIAKEDGRGMA